MRKNNSMLGFKILKFILAPIFKIYYHPTIIGKENIPKTGPIILAGNHKHLYDQCLVIIATKRPIHYMAKKEYFESKVKWFFKMAGCIRVDRDIKDENAVNLALQVLKNNEALGVFPEGTRNKTNQFLLPFKFGAVSMAKKADAWLVPFGITGNYKFRNKNLTIRFGKPFKIVDMELEEANKRLEKEVSNLMKQN